jgi:virginiamycin B lyase
MMRARSQGGRLTALAAFASAAFASAAIVGLGSGLVPGAAAQTPKVTELQLPAGGSTHELVVGPGNKVWVTQQNQAHLVRITPKGKLRVFGLPAGSGPHGIDFDKHGRLWVTLEFANAIAMVDRKTGRIVKRYPIALKGAGPHGLRVARNGRVWWTGKAGNAVGYLDPRTGRMRIFMLPHPDSTPIYAAEGCDGMYFTELTGSRIARVTDAGAVTEWATPTQGARPIAVAPRDCRIWFSEESGHHYGVLDPRTGVIVEYPLLRPDDQLTGMAFDGRGTLWLQHDRPDAIGVAGPAGELSAFPIPTTGATMHRLIRGPGGRMWFTELAVDKVGFFKPPA